MMSLRTAAEYRLQSGRSAPSSAHVEGLLGYGAEQFRQIVLLPQGRFERFLVSNSKDRLEILRELFDVSLYRRLTEKLKADAANIRREIEDGLRLYGAPPSTRGLRQLGRTHRRHRIST